MPPNQRPYKWDDPHVQNLLQDLYEAIQNDEEDYFLGTIVLIQKPKDLPSIVDGQQRLVTTSILLARIRDKQIEFKRPARADAIEKQYLRDMDIDTEERTPRLHLNPEDHQYFVNSIISRPDERGDGPPQKLSGGNRHMQRASDICGKFLNSITENMKPENKSDYLVKWVKFIRDAASVVVVTAPDEVGAFRMFETLNDRGLKAGAADILKNYLFSKAGDRLNEAQKHWNSITTAIEALGDDEDDRLVTFLRHFWVLSNGPTKERELATKIKRDITGETKALSFLAEASSAVDAYVALWSSRHPFWAKHKPATRNSVDTIAEHLRVEQIRPLLFAVALHFNPTEAEKAFRLFVSWSVRFLIFGGRGGMLDEQYSRRAQEVGTERITTARELRDAMGRYVPTDAEFHAAFATARVSRAHLARYYLRAIDKVTKDDPQPEFVSNEDMEQLTLDHILPLSSSEAWVTNEEAEAVQKMLGNLVLLKPNQNREISGKSFNQRRDAYAHSAYNVTRMVAEHSRWGADEIRARQTQLARLALQAWPTSLAVPD